MPDHIAIGDIRPRIQYAADGVQTAFTYPFPIFAPEDLKVYVGAELQGAGVAVSGAGQSGGGTATFAVAPAAGATVTLLRALAIARTSDFQEGGAFRAKTINDELDRQTAFVQEAVERIERAIVAAPTETAAPLVLPPPDQRANALLGFDAEGAPIATTGTAGAIPIAVAMVPVVQAATLTAARQLLGILGNERLAKTGATTVANADKGKTIACGAGPWTLTFAAASGYDADFAVLVSNESAPRGIKLDLNGSALWLYPGQTALVYRQDTAWRTLRPERWKLSAAITIYVDATNGNNSNDGLASGSGNALQTIQAAVDRLADHIDCGSFQVVIQLADGTYTAGASLRPYVGRSAPIIQGNATTPANVVVSTTNADCFPAYDSGRWTIKDMKVQTATAGHGIIAVGISNIYIANLNFGVCVYNHMLCGSGAAIQAIGNYSISGGASIHILADGCGDVEYSGKTVTISGAPNFSFAFALATNCGVIRTPGNSYSGSATGKRYDVQRNGVIETGGGASYFPGNVAGTVGTGGQYQ